MRTDLVPVERRAASLADVLDRVLDKGLVVAGDIRVSLAEVELLTIRIRLIVCSLDKAQEIGLDWWRHDRHLTSGSPKARRGSQRLVGPARARTERSPRSARGRPAVRISRIADKAKRV